MNTIYEIINHLDKDARQTVEIGLGEAIRLGHSSLGVEFILMGLSRQDTNGLWELLLSLRIHPGEFRGILRSLVGVRSKNWRMLTDVRTIGGAALPSLTVTTSPNKFDLPPHNNLQSPDVNPVISPVLFDVLKKAIELSGNELASPNHILLAAIQNVQSQEIKLLFSLMEERNIDPNQFIKRLLYLSGVKPDTFSLEDQGRETQSNSLENKPSTIPGILAKYGRDLTRLAKSGEIGQAKGEYARKAMAQMGLILQQSQSNNPLLLGDPGVGKTAIVEGFAWRLACDSEVIKILSGRLIIDLPVTSLLAGTSYRGELEERLQRILEEVRKKKNKLIIFIDEIHSIMAGKTEGGLGAIADALKPALARGEFPCIGATTIAEYRRYIETDPALARRFTPVWIEEPSIPEAIEIAKEIADNRLASHHSVIYPKDVVEEAVKLSVRYLHDEFLPGKSIKLLDQAGPRVTMGGSLRGVNSKNFRPQVAGTVTIDIIRQIVSDRTGIPLTSISKSERERLLELEITLQKQVCGQDQAIQAVSSIVRRNRAGLADPRRPLGVLLFAGPSGVGKTELALSLASVLFDEEKAFLRIDMSEFMEKYQVSRLIGSPPGYVGFDEEGQLTGRLRSHPYCVVLLDEMEKAHTDVQHLFLQLFDAGRISDARGRLVDGRNAFFIMTTNLDQAGIERRFTTEFRNRLDDVIYFNPLTDEVLIAIFDKIFNQVEQRFAEKGIQVELSQEYKKRFCSEHKNPEFGARPLQRAINDRIIAAVADRLLTGEIGRTEIIEPGFVIRPLPVVHNTRFDGT